MSTTGRDMVLGCGRAMIVRLLSIVIGFPLGLMLVFSILWLMTSLYGRVSSWVLFGLFGLGIVLLLSAAVAVLALSIYGRKRKLDAIFCPLGLQGQAYLSFFRQYHGTINDRQVDVYISRGPRLEIEVSTSLKTRLGVTGPYSDTRFLADLFNKPILPVGDPELVVFPYDEAWTCALFNNPHAREIFKRLIASDSIFIRRQILLRPDTFQLLLTGSTQMLGFNPDPALLRTWVNDLLRLTHIAEHLPAPTVIDELTRLEQQAYRVRKANPYLALWFGVGLFGFFAIVSVLAAILVVILSRLN